MKFGKNFSGRRLASIAILTLTCAAGLLGGCSGGSSSNNGTPTVPAGSLVGVWRETTISTDTASVTCPGTLTVPNVGTQSCAADATITFNANQTFVANNGGGSNLQTAGTWRVDGDTLTLQTASAIGTTVSQEFRITLTNNVLTAAVKLSNSVSNSPYTITYTQQATQ